ncbi:MAG: hydroxymethylbilane synthase [Phycisphaerales bacterium]|jgi:hydroxymethylbilane synthase|nr:hydroxymethylbilane synthase [Phycisphaerales bacterium]
MSESTHTLRLGTRGSLLAKTQSQLVASELEKRHKGLAVELIVLKTSGDAIADKPLYEFGGKGLFTKEIEIALQRQEIDVAVHSFKDVPVTQPLVAVDDLVVAAVPPREDPRDVFCSLMTKQITDLPREAKIGTSSLRRKCQLLAIRPDLKIEVLRGNIDTRLRKLRDGAFDAIVLAAAGLRRTGLFNEAEMVMLDPDQMLPAPGQGALAVQCRRNDERTRELLSVLDDSATERCVTAERIIVQALGGDCHSPIGALAEIGEDENMTVRVAVGSKGGTPPICRATASCPCEHPDGAVGEVLKLLSDQNVKAVLGHDR